MWRCPYFYYQKYGIKKRKASLQSKWFLVLEQGARVSFKMKLFIVLSVLSVVGLVVALPPAEFEESNIVEEQDTSLVPLGLERSNRRLLRRQFTLNDSNKVQTVNYNWLGNVSIRISSWSMTRVGSAQGASFVRTSGGVGTNHLSLRMTTARGRGLNYILEIWGR
ncbi:hypothetical protein evm_003613 [Chilo suppressalis]|nr:hypothetical protein evm_003613 [Chilo suppressalis]